jgi:hypothetical protein
LEIYLYFYFSIDAITKSILTGEEAKVFSPVSIWDFGFRISDLLGFKPIQNPKSKIKNQLAFNTNYLLQFGDDFDEVFLVGHDLVYGD